MNRFLVGQAHIQTGIGLRDCGIYGRWHIIPANTPGEAAEIFSRNVERNEYPLIEVRNDQFEASGRVFRVIHEVSYRTEEVESDELG